MYPQGHVKVLPAGASDVVSPAPPQADPPGPHTQDLLSAPEKRAPASETVLLAGSMVLFFVLLYEMHVYGQEASFLSPPVVAAAGAMLLWPLRQQRAARTLLLTGGLLMLLWLLDVLSGVFLPFALVYLLAFLFNPVATRLQSHYRVPRSVSAMGITVLVVGFVLLFVLLLVPSLVGELETLARRALEEAGRLRAWLASSTALDQLEHAGLVDKEALLNQMTAAIQAQSQALMSHLPDVAQQLIKHLNALFGLVTIAAIMPVALYFTLKDYPYINRRLLELFPTFGGRRDYLVEASTVVGGYLRGQLIISAIAAFNVSVALLLLGVPFALLIGLLGGLLNLIPNLGAIITAVLGVLVAVLFGDPWYLDALTVLLVLLGQNLLEQSVLTPQILCRHVGLHPVLILLSLFVFGYFFGFFGLLIAVPATALLMTVYKAFRHELALELAPERHLRYRLARKLLRHLRKRMPPASPPPAHPS